MSKKANNLAELEARKAQLESEIDSLKGDLTIAVDGIKEDIEQKSRPQYWIDKFPLQLLAVSVATGFGFGIGFGKKGSKGDSPSAAPNPIAASIGDEIKRMLMKKGTEMLMAAITERLEAYKK